MTAYGFPSFFITINNSPVKVLAGHEIDIDKLLPDEIPKYWDQSVLIAQNPVVAAKFFNVYIKAFIKTILSFDADTKKLTRQSPWRR